MVASISLLTGCQKAVLWGSLVHRAIIPARLTDRRSSFCSSCEAEFSAFAMAFSVLQIRQGFHLTYNLLGVIKGSLLDLFWIYCFSTVGKKNDVEKNEGAHLGFPGGSDGKDTACNVEGLALIPGSGSYPLEKGMAAHSSILSWRIPWTEDPGGLSSMGSQSRTRLSS